MQGLMKLLVALGLCAAAGLSHADGFHHHHGHGHGHGGGGVRFGVVIGPTWGPWYNYPPYPSPVYYPPVVIERAPTVYVEQVPTPVPVPAPVAPTVSPQPANYWYYCQAAQGYYPYVKQCPGGWVKVLPKPPAQ